jgi:hypothetical protein
MMTGMECLTRERRSYGRGMNRSKPWLSTTAERVALITGIAAVLASAIPAVVKLFGC